MFNIDIDQYFIDICIRYDNFIIPYIICISLLVMALIMPIPPLRKYSYLSISKYVFFIEGHVGTEQKYLEKCNK